MSTDSTFAERLIAWQKIHGRHDLPWQNTRDPYAIWVSEIMLQQTQVGAVIGYYQKFMQCFPDVASLANATQDEVLQHWSGLGYYSRARNLHNAAQVVMDEFSGVFPQDFEQIQRLPGIGRSTAAAIASFAFNQVQTILDGNVKRVLARHFVVEGWPSHPKIEKQLWQLAESLLPKNDIVAYTQGLMDLGATLCTRSKPRCTSCPLKQSCGALQQHRTHELPSPKPRKTIPEREITMLVILHGNELMLEKRPPSGIWGGLWSLPEISTSEDPQQIAQQRFGIEAKLLPALPTFSHTFTHFKLHITPQPLQVSQFAKQASESKGIWLSLDDAIGAALPTPIRKIIQHLK